MRIFRHQGRVIPGLPAGLFCAVLGITLLFAPEPGPRFIVTQLPSGAAEGLTSRSDGMLPAEYGAGARIVLVSPGSPPRILTGGFHGALDPEVSFDGKRLLFAGKRKASDRWDIYEMSLDGGEPRQITRDLGDCRSPLYLGSFYTIDSSEPWDQIAFTATAAGELNEHGAEPSTSLYTARLDGSSVKRITYNPSSDLGPAVLPDGRILFSSWQRSTLDHGSRGRISLFASQTDGLDYGLFSGDEGRRIKLMPAVTTKRSVVFVEGDALPWDGSGSLGMVRLRRNLHSYEEVTGLADGLFHSPSPLPDGRVLVSRRPRDAGGTHGVHRLDPETGLLEAVFDDPNRHDIQARLVAPRPRPDGRSSVVSEKFDSGKLYGLNVYQSDLGGDWIRPGTPVRLRVLEGIPLRRGSAPDEVEGTPSLAKKRFLGEVAVEKDGSFNVEVPANIPIQLQLIDGDGISLRSCGWIWVRNRETRGCIGCHEDGEMAPENRFVDAVAKPSKVLTLPPARRRTVDFRRDVAPVIQKKCSVAACHGDDGVPPALGGDGDRAARAYRNLMIRAPGWEEDRSPWGKYVHPGSARKSPLICSLYGMEVARPWDVGHESCTVPPMPPVGWQPLTDDERRTLVEWIDLGAQWAGGSP